MNEAAMPISTMCVPAALRNEVVPTEGFSSEIEQIQQYLSSHYAFKHNKVTNRVLVKTMQTPIRIFIIWRITNSTIFFGRSKCAISSTQRIH